MQNTPDNRRPRGPQPKRQRIVLPFEKKKTDAGTWAYEHKVGLCVTVIAYLIVGIVFMSSKIMIGSENRHESMMIMIEPMPEPEPPQQLTPEERKELEEQLRDVKNAVSNENAKTTVSATQRSNAIPQEMTEAADALADKLRGSREAYEKGLKEEQDIINARHAKTSPTENEKVQDVKVKGNVTISYSLTGRTAVFLHTPSYQCEGGGEVVVTIVVNRNGKVLAASVKSSSTTDDCLLDRAVSSARQSRFNVDSSAPDKQTGTITYLFIPQ